MYKLIFTTFILAFHSFKTQAQVLAVDRENGQDSIPKKLSFSWSSGLSLDKQKSSLLEIESIEELDIFLPKNQLIILVGNTAFQTNGRSILENNGYFMFRLRDNDKKRVAPDYFAQYQWNGILGLQNRSLAGVNARFKFWDKKESDLFISTGLFYEYENWNPTLSSFDFDSTITSVSRNILRWNNAFKMALKISENIDFATSNYVQFPLNEKLNHILQPRWAMSSSIFFKVNKHLNIIGQFNHNLDLYRALPIDRYYYDFNFAIQLAY
jgi:hypothetical protein